MSGIFELITSKRAVRDFRDEALPAEMVRQILESGRLAGSAKNMQPWYFIAVQNRATLNALSQCGEFADHMAGASLGIALVTPDPFLRLTVPFDLGRAAQNMMLTAWGAGIGSEMATIYQQARAMQILGIPERFTLPWCISFGYPVEPTTRPPRKGGRRPAEDVFHFEKW
jgi:nitroreductase